MLLKSGGDKTGHYKKSGGDMSPSISTANDPYADEPYLTKTLYYTFI